MAIFNETLNCCSLERQESRRNDLLKSYETSVELSLCMSYKKLGLLNREIPKLIFDVLF